MMKWWSDDVESSSEEDLKITWENILGIILNFKLTY